MPKYIAPLPLMSFPDAAPATGLWTAPLVYTPQIRWAEHGVKPPDIEPSFFPLRMVIARPYREKIDLHRTDQAAVQALANDMGSQEWGPSMGISRLAAERRLSRIYSDLGVTNNCSAVTVRILAGEIETPALDPGPTLNYTDIQFMAYKALGLTSTEIAELFDCTERGVNKRCDDIRDRLEVEHLSAAIVRLFGLGQLLVGENIIQ